MDFLYRLISAFSWAKIQFTYGAFLRTYGVEYCFGDNLIELLGDSTPD